MDDATKQKIAEFVKERDALLIEGNMEKIVEFFKKHNPGRSIPAPNVLEIALHKARTAAVALPIELRKQSHRWLLDHGYSSWMEEKAADDKAD